MIRLFDRVLCLVFGHCWERVWHKDARRCVHCDRLMSAKEAFERSQRRVLWNLEEGYPTFSWPKRVW